MGVRSRLEAAGVFCVLQASRSIIEIFVDRVRCGGQLPFTDKWRVSPSPSQLLHHDADSLLYIIVYQDSW